MKRDGLRKSYWIEIIGDEGKIIGTTYVGDSETAALEILRSNEQVTAVRFRLVCTYDLPTD